MYYLQLISLKGCPYSKAAESLLKNNNIKHEITSVSNDEKDKFKTNKIRTFPQIYLKKQNSTGSVLIGGYDTIKKYYDQANSSKNLDKLKKEIKSNSEYISDKSVLRLIELLVNFQTF